jgi:hypothetical protein
VNTTTGSEAQPRTDLGGPLTRSELHAVVLPPAQRHEVVHLEYLHTSGIDPTELDVFSNSLRRVPLQRTGQISAAAYEGMQLKQSTKVQST